MNSVERQQYWQEQLNNHGENCDNCRDGYTCFEHEFLTKAYNVAYHIPEQMTRAERVNKGALVLDDVYPDWASEIDFHIFNIDHTYDCILGQLYNGYYTGMRRVFGEMEFPEMNHVAVVHGFNMLQSEWDGEYDDKYQATSDYRAAWLNEVDNRLAKI